MSNKNKGFGADLDRSAIRVGENPPADVKETMMPEALGEPAPSPLVEPLVKEPHHRMTINIPARMHKELRREAFESGRTMTELLIRAWDHAHGR